MTDYTKSTNFTSKDTLPTGSALKIIKGAEFDTEFNAIATAIATKVNTSDIGTTVQAYDADLTTLGAGGSAARSFLGLTIGTNVQAWDADLDTWATKTAPSGTVVGTTDTQTLTNKTLSTGTIVGTSLITSGTAVASTSGTNIDFTSIPSWVKRITVMFTGVSTNGTSPPQIQIGSGSVTTSGYLGSNTFLNASVVSGANFTTGFGIGVSVSFWNAATIFHGSLVLTLQTGNTWVCAGSNGISNAVGTYLTNGSIALGGALDRVRITTVGGTDTFDAGSINILYE